MITSEEEVLELGPVLRSAQHEYPLQSFRKSVLLSLCSAQLSASHWSTTYR